MFKNYILLALRQLRRNRGYSFINIFGLATGMAIALVIGIWANDELSIDQDIPRGDRVVEIMQNQWPKGQTSEKTPPSYVGFTVSAGPQPLAAKRKVSGCLRPNGDDPLGRSTFAGDGRQKHRPDRHLGGIYVPAHFRLPFPKWHRRIHARPKHRTYFKIDGDGALWH